MSKNAKNRDRRKRSTAQTNNNDNHSNVVQDCSENSSTYKAAKQAGNRTTIIIGESLIKNIHSWRLKKRCARN